ncbi:MAG: putative lipid II flippase FtsW [Gammaproteobacteria bacterium]|jgi:cell division protein FtsW|nr:putative lipid II flippase FtsW [Gammaproteobacteria bacterium]
MSFLLKANHTFSNSRLDPLLISSIIALLSLGLLMVTSASIAIAEQRIHQPFYYTIHQGVAMLVGVIGAFFVCSIPIRIWFRFAAVLMVMALVSLVLVLIPGIGKVVNGSARWLNLGVTSVQVSEFCKLAVVIYISSYVVRHNVDLKQKVSGFIRPMLLLSVVGALLILEPDFGATVVILTTTLAMLFLAGVPLWQFMALLTVVAGVLGAVAISAPYRLARLTSFLDPWARQFDSGYQLTQALIAFGRGEWFGVGLGSSIQKLFYLPEAYTDFVFAVLAEELGLVGAIATVGLYILFVWRGMIVGLNAEKRNDRFAAFVSYGISLWVGLQTLINIGVNTGVLPTKGLTLPFLSYGGSSVFVICIAVGLIVRVDYENRLAQSRETTIGRKRK